MNSVFDKLTIMYKGEIISEEGILKNFLEFLMNETQKKEHNTSFSLHTGSICFDVVAIVWAAIYDILFSKESQLDILKGLSKDASVIYYSGIGEKSKKQRCKFLGFGDQNGNIKDDGDYVLLEQKGGTLFVPVSKAGLVQPCDNQNGKLGVKGLKKSGNRRIEFIANLLDKPQSEVVNVVRLSTIVVMSMHYSGELVKNISLLCNGFSIRLTELIPISYYANVDSKPVSYGDNSIQVEPVLKIVSNIDVAREFILRKIGNPVAGLVVLGDDCITKSESSLPQLINKKSLKYSLLSSKISSKASYNLLKSEEESSLFACTKEYLDTVGDECVIRGKYTEILEKQLRGIRNNNFVDVSLCDFITVEQYNLFRKNLLRITKSEYSCEEKDNFIVQAFSLMNLFLTAVFPLNYFDCPKEKLVSVKMRSVQEKLAYIKQIARMIPGDIGRIKEDVLDIISVLEAGYYWLREKSEKNNALNSLLLENMDKRIGIIVPKKYYAEIIYAYVPNYMQKDVDVLTKRDFAKENTYYDVIIDVGVIREYEKYNIFLHGGDAAKVIILTYGIEKYKLEKARKISMQFDDYYNSCMGLKKTLVSELLAPNNIEGNNNQQDYDVESIDDMLVDYIRNVTWSIPHGSVGKSTGYVDAAAVAKFESGDVVYFSLNYIAYVYDYDSVEIKEKSVKELSEGDTVVFTRGSKNSVDIVDVIFDKMITEGKFSEEVKAQYSISKLWKQALQRYAKSTGKSIREIAKDMVEKNAPVQMNTIVNWYSEESHTVGPSQIESLQFIADYTEDLELGKKIRNCFDSCNQVRKIRKKILSLMSEAILSKLGRKINEKDIIYQAVQDQVDNLARIITIENIRFVNDSVPVNMINRPLSDF